MRFRRGCRGWWLAALAFGADRLTKAAVQGQATARALIPGLVRCQPVRNSGMAFSMLSGQFALLTAVTALLILGLAIYLIRKPEEPPLTRAGFWLVVGGGLGNLADRLAYGAVIDFIELEFVRFAIFNVADICVCVGAGLAMLGMLLAERQRKVRGDGGI